LNGGERYDDITDHRGYTTGYPHNLNGKQKKKKIGIVMGLGRDDKQKLKAVRAIENLERINMYQTSKNSDTTLIFLCLLTNGSLHPFVTLTQRL